MRILLDARPLQSPGAAAEKSRLVFAAAAALSASEGIEWVVLSDRRAHSGLFPILPGKVVIRRALPGLVGWRYWYQRQVPRLARQSGADRVWLTGGVTGGAGTGGLPVCVWMPERVDPDDAGRPGPGSEYRRALKTGLADAAAILCYSDRDRSW